jgi:hypothetical protein
MDDMRRQIQQQQRVMDDMLRRQMQQQQRAFNNIFKGGIKPRKKP